jgi:hypothetical protein
MSMAAAASLGLAAAHIRIWLRWRASPENLLFAVTGAAAGAAAVIELGMLHARTPAEYGDLLRWLHVPVGVLTIALAWLITSYLRAGRAWLAWLITGLRGLVLVANFSTPWMRAWRPAGGAPDRARYCSAGPSPPRRYWLPSRPT